MAKPPIGKKNMDTDRETPTGTTLRLMDATDPSPKVLAAYDTVKWKLLTTAEDIQAIAYDLTGNVGKSAILDLVVLAAKLECLAHELRARESQAGAPCEPK